MSKTVETPAAKPVEAPTATMEAKNNDAGVTAIDASPKEDPDDQDSIAATVNDESISDYEVRQRVALYLATSGHHPETDGRADQAHPRPDPGKNWRMKRSSFRKRLKKKITVSPVEVDKRINGMMAENHFTIQQLRSTLGQAGATEDALRAQITASIAWLKTVQDEYADHVNISPDMVSAEMAKNAEGANKAHFHVLEIFLPVDNPDREAKVKKDAEDIINQLHQGCALLGRRAPVQPASHRRHRRRHRLGL